MVSRLWRHCCSRRSSSSLSAICCGDNLGGNTAIVGHLTHKYQRGFINHFHVARARVIHSKGVIDCSEEGWVPDGAAWSLLRSGCCDTGLLDRVGGCNGAPWRRYSFSAIFLAISRLSSSSSQRRRASSRSSISRLDNLGGKTAIMGHFTQRHQSGLINHVHVARKRLTHSKAEMGLSPELGAPWGWLECESGCWDNGFPRGVIGGINGSHRNKAEHTRPSNACPTSSTDFSKDRNG